MVKSFCCTGLSAVFDPESDWTSQWSGRPRLSDCRHRQWVILWLVSRWSAHVTTTQEDRTRWMPFAWISPFLNATHMSNTIGWSNFPCSFRLASVCCKTGISCTFPGLSHYICGLRTFLGLSHYICGLRTFLGLSHYICGLRTFLRSAFPLDARHNVRTVWGRYSILLGESLWNRRIKGELSVPHVC